MNIEGIAIAIILGLVVMASGFVLWLQCPDLRKGWGNGRWSRDRYGD